MRRALVITVLVLVLVLALAGPAAATNEHAADRACVGEFMSAAAQSGQHGSVVSSLAQELQGMGTTMSRFARTCDPPEVLIRRYPM